MEPVRKAGRIVGALLLLQLIAGLTLPFILMRPIVAGAPGFLASAAENSLQLRLAVLIAFAGSALTISLGITAFPVLRKYSAAAALWFLAVCAVSCALDAVHSGTVLSMITQSQQFVRDGADAAAYQIPAAAVAAARRSAHIVQLFGIGAWILVFYGALFRFNLIPRTLAGLGLLGIILQFTGVTLMMHFGLSPIGEMAIPMLPIQIITAVWLIIKGFTEPLPGPNSGMV